MTRHILSWMDDRIHRNTMRALKEEWGNNPPAWATMDVTSDENIQHRLSMLLDGVADEDVAALREHLAKWYREQPITVDELELTLARRTGTDMLAAMCIASELRNNDPSVTYIDIIRGPAKRAVLTLKLDGNALTMSVPLSTEARWENNALIISRVLPNTFQIAVLGKALSNVVSHPLLDPLGLTIENIEIVKDRETRLITNRRREERGIIEISREAMLIDESVLDQRPPSRKAPTSNLSSPF